MSSVSENGILDKRDFEAFKHRTVESKFRHQLFLGIGGATVFGLVGAFGKALLDIAMIGGAGAGLAWAGLAAIGVLGIGCIYMGSKFLSESILMDQDFQAKKIALATDPSRAHVLTTPTIEPVKTTHTTPPGMEVNAQENETKWTDKHGPRKDADLAVQKQPVENWADEVRDSEKRTEQEPSRTIH